jgi:hypothetical protein
MLAFLGTVLLLVWLLGILGAFDAGKLVHGFLLFGLMLLLAALKKAVDGPSRTDSGPLGP